MLQRLSDGLHTWQADEGVMPNEEDFDLVIQWIDWTLAFLEARRLYHKKAYVRRAMLEQMAKTLLSPDELEAINLAAENRLTDEDDDLQDPEPHLVPREEEE